MSKVLIAGVGMTPFGKHMGRGYGALAVAAIDEALLDAGIPVEDVERIYFGNAAAGIVSQQEMIRGQVALRNHRLAARPLINVENACASGGSALFLGFEAIKSGMAEVVLVVGTEQLNHEDRSRPFNALRGATDIGEIGEAIPGEVASSSLLMEYYAGVAQSYLDRYDATAEDFARVAVKNRRHAAGNPLAHLRKPQTLEDVIGSRMIVSPLTLPMCSPTTDGGAALLLCSESYARRLGAGGLELLTSKIGPGAGGSPVQRATQAVYEATGLGPNDFDMIELHDAAAPAELLQYSEIGICEEGQAHHLVRRGETDIGGRIPVNTSGGLLSRGHPLGATGCAQIAELCTQLRGRAGSRQLAKANIGLAVNGGGWLDGRYALAIASVVRKIN
ncbi:MAG: thiolase family protein [Rhodocyclaceae bacterium]|nr:thiolase family protein [Rhodocyclaceae bacterium]